MTKYPDLFAALCAPFEPHEVKIRQAPGGRQLHYITARTAMNRLDVVVGPENWWDEYIPGNDSVMCRLTIRLPDGETLTKMDAGGYAGMADAGDDDKSGFSDAFKRACAKFGVSRYLYRDGVPAFAGDGEAPPEPERHERRPEPQRETARTMPPPAGHPGDPGRNDPPRGQQQGSPFGNLPRSGRALWPWAKEMGQKFEVDVIKYIQNWGKLQDFPERIVDFDESQTAAAVAEACRKIKEIDPGAKAGAEGELKELRGGLWNAVLAILSSRGYAHQGKPDKPEVTKVLDELSSSAGGEVMAGIATCSDAGLLRKYIDAATNLLQTEAAA
jgi:hypothetical protein